MLFVEGAYKRFIRKLQESNESPEELGRIVEYLISNNAYIKSISLGRPVLIIAAYKGHKDVLIELLNKESECG